MDIPQMFILHAPEDWSVKNRIERYLKEYIREQKLSITPDITADQPIDHYYMESVKNSRIILMLWTSDFLADDTLVKIGEYVANLHHNKMHNVLPVLVKQCLYDFSESFKHLKKIPRNGESLSESDENIIFQQISDAIAALLYMFSLENEIQKANETIKLMAIRIAELEKNKK